MATGTLARNQEERCYLWSQGRVKRIERCLSRNTVGYDATSGIRWICNDMPWIVAIRIRDMRDW